MSTRTAAKIAADKELHPEKYCPQPRCLWRTGDGSRCPRHKREEVGAAMLSLSHLECSGGQS